MYEIIISNHFRKQLKIYSRKDVLLKERLHFDLMYFTKESGVAIGKRLYKFRVKAYNKGKSGGYRLIVFIIEEENILVPIHIYSKNHKENATEKEVAEHLEITKFELGL